MTDDDQRTAGVEARLPEPFVRSDVRQFLDWLNSLPGPKSHEVGAEGARQMMRTWRQMLDVDLGELAVLRDFAAPGPDGPVPIRLYDCRPERGPTPLLVFYHGGGFVLGDFETHDPLCAEISRGLDLPVVAVDYRLAPEWPFPAGIEDSIAATRWLAASPGELGLEVTGLVLAGDSAGGNFAIVTTIALRDEPAHVPVIAQWPIYPAADPAVSYPSYRQFADGHLLTKEGMDWFEQCYTGVADDWRYSPLRKPQQGVPPTLIVTAGLDPIRDQGRAYAAACAAAGVTTVYLELEGAIHGFMNLRKAIPSANDDLERCLKHLRLLIGGGR